MQYHFINTDRFRPDAEVRRQVRDLHNAGDSLVTLIVAHLIPEKGIEVALQALTRLQSNVSLWIVGSGPEQQRLAERCAELGLSERVLILGQQSHVESYMQACDLLLCPSIWAEAAGLVNLEAQACGLPVVASRIGGIPEHVVDERTGLLFEPGDSADLARQLSRLIKDPDLRDRLAAAARPWVVAMFSVDRRVPEILENYRNLGGQRWD
jgi:glycosyltransferase involved in cell wall biosynthesis